jgi:hypothetical protein
MIVRSPDRERRCVRVLAIVAGLAAACAYVNTREAGFATLEEARQAGAIAAGNVPDHLPASARDIRERHRMDGSEVWGRFEFGEPDRASIART